MADEVDLELFARHMARVVEASRMLEGPSLASRLARHPQRDVFLREVELLGPLVWQRLLYDWRFWGRPKQLAPAGSWDTWVELAGRGFGKNRLAAEWILQGAAEDGAGAILIGPTFEDTRRYMVGGAKGRGRNGSGILDCAPPWLIPDPQKAHKQTAHEIHCANGAIIYYTSAEKPELRGANLARAWCDELCVWPHAEALWDNLGLTLREKSVLRPQVLVTTTPRPIDLLRAIILEPGTVTIHGVTDENRENVHGAWLEKMHRRLGGTRLGRQELEAEILGDNPDALFAMSAINAARVDVAPVLIARAVAVDPALTTSRYADETGIVVMGVDSLDDLYVLADLTGRHKPEAWGTLVAKAARDWDADVVVERTAGGQLVAANVRAAEARLTDRGRPIRIAEVEARGEKRLRAEPVATLYEQGRVHHVGHHPQLEAEITEWDPRTRVSPNRLDALVHGANRLCRELSGKPRTRDAFVGLEHVRAAMVRPAGPGPLRSLLGKVTRSSEKL